MESQKKDLRISQKIEYEIQANKQLVYIGFIFMCAKFFIDLLFDLFSIFTIGFSFSNLFTIMYFVRIILQIFSVIGTVVLVIGLTKLRNNFAGAFNTSLKKITFFLGIGFGYLYIFSFSINLITPSWGIFTEIIYVINRIVGIASFIIIILAIIEIRKAINELVKILPTYNTSFLSLYPIIASYIIFSITTVLSIVFHYVEFNLTIYSYIYYALAILCNVALGLGMIEIGTKFKQINEYEIAHLAQISQERQSITDFPFNDEDESIKDL